MQSSPEASASSYFENPNRDQDTDFTDVINMKGAFQEIEKDVNANISDTMVDFNQKIETLLKYRAQLFLNHLQSIHETSYIELNVSITNTIFIN